LCLGLDALGVGLGLEASRRFGLLLSSFRVVGRRFLRGWSVGSFENMERLRAKFQRGIGEVVGGK
jgi:hypothetical protein